MTLLDVALAWIRKSVQKRQSRIRAPKRVTPSATTQKIIDHVLRLADPNCRADREVERTMLVMMRVQRPTLRRPVRGDL